MSTNLEFSDFSSYDSKPFKAFHHFWEDDIIFHKNNYFSRGIYKNCGRWYIKNKDLLLKWNDWGDQVLEIRDTCFSSDSLLIISQEDLEQKNKIFENAKKHFKSIKGFHSIPRLGTMRLWNDKNTIIPLLISTCKVFDKISIIYHKGGNDDGCVDLVREFLSEGRNERCDVSIHYYPYDVYFPHNPFYKTEWHRGHPSSFSNFSDFSFKVTTENFNNFFWLLLDTDNVYLPEALENCFFVSEFLYKQDISLKINILSYDTCPYENKLWWARNNTLCGIYGDHILFPPNKNLKGYSIDIGHDEHFLLGDDKKVMVNHYIHSPMVCGFQFRKRIWTGGEYKLSPNYDLLTPLNEDVKNDFNKYIREILKEGNSAYYNLELS